MDAKLRAAIDNLVSRMVGFFARSLVLLTAMLMTGGTFIMSVAIVLIWPLVPLAIIYCLMRTFT